MSIRKRIVRTALVPFGPAVTTRDLKRSAFAKSQPRHARGPSTEREPVLAYAASGMAAALLGLLLGRRLLRSRG